LLEVLELLLLLAPHLGFLGGELLVHHRLEIGRAGRRLRRRGQAGPRGRGRGGRAGGGRGARPRRRSRGRSLGRRGRRGGRNGGWRRGALAAVQEDEGQDGDQDQRRDGGVQQGAAL